MTTRQLLDALGHHPLVLVAIFVALPVLALAVSLFHKREAAGESPWKFIYSTLVYLACIAGVPAVIVIAYMLFFTHDSLLDVGLVIFLPIISMIATLVLIRRTVNFDLLPGFDRLWGLMVMIGVAFTLALAIEKTRIFLFFGGSIVYLFAFIAFAVALMKWGLHRLARRSDDPKTPPPQPPALG